MGQEHGRHPHGQLARTTDPVEAIKDLTGGFGVDVAIDAVGHPDVYEQAFYARDLAGTVVLVGVPNPTMTIELPLIEVFGRGGALKSSWYGDCLPSRDFPMLIDLYLQGRFDLDAFVSETIGLDDVERPSRRCTRARSCARVVVLLSGRAIDKVVVSGVFSLDGQDFDVDNNVWLVGDDDEVLVIDAPHDAAPIVEAIGGRRVTAIVLTHGHNDHITAAVALREATGAPIWFNPADRMLWDVVHPDSAPDRRARPRGRRSTSPGRRSIALHTPGHSPGSTCLYARGPRHGLHRRHAVLRRARARPAGRSATTRRSSSRSAPGC